jgi:3-phenylpropionate/trans-cinnamate dioxygenase ferredoxin reductase subunit
MSASVPSGTLAIIGASLAGAKAAEAAREAGHDGRILLIGDELTAPYERPPLSKKVLRGEADESSTHVHPDGFYAEHGIEVITDEVTEIAPDDRRLHLASGGQVGFASAVVATGAAPRRLELPGAELGGVHYLRTIEDSLRLREAIRTASRVAVVGGGWIGSEVAASARQMGADVVLIDPAPTPLHRVLGREVGGIFAALHADHGVVLRMGVGVSALRGAARVEEVVLSDGRVEPADVVVVGIGVTPRTSVVEGAPGVRIDNGIVVDERLETDIPRVYAAGDVANAWHPHFERHLRVEHWANALNQGTTAGRNAAGRHEVYDRLPYFFSDQYDLGLEYIGYSQPDDAVVIRGDADGREFLAFWHRDGIVSAALAVNIWDVVDDFKAIVGAGRALDPGRLVDPDIALADVG